MMLRWIKIALVAMLIAGCGEVTANPFVEEVDGGADSGNGNSNDAGTGGSGIGGGSGTGGDGGDDDDDDDGVSDDD